jgi:hypothetical protein
MKLEKQVCNIEQSKQLKELLKNYETNFFWVELPEGNYLATKKNVDENLAFDRNLGDNMVAVNRVASAWKSIHPAFTDSELAVMLDAYYETYKTKNDMWAVVPDGITFETPAEASADRLIELLKNESLSAEGCNERLIA